MSITEKKLSYFISEKEKFLVITLQGPADRTFEHIVEECLERIRLSKAEFIVINLHDVTQFDRQGLSFFVKLEKQIRNKPAQLRICCINSIVNKFLNEEGAVRNNEVAPDLPMAIQSFKTQPNTDAAAA